MKKRILLFTPAILSLGYLVGCNITTSRYVITFNTQSESKIESQTVKNGSKVVEPISPSKTGYMFDKWTTDLAGKNVYNFETPVTKSFELYAQYSDNFHVVAFDLGEDKIEKQQIRDGEKISYSPTKEGYTFTHWELNGKFLMLTLL